MGSEEGIMTYDIETSMSDRITFKRCRRKWDWSSRNRSNLIPLDTVPDPNLWFGSAFHFALEDYHGVNQFGAPERAFRAFVDAHQMIDQDLPENVRDLIDLADRMLAYYTQYWEPKRQDFQTLWIDDIPQTEVKFEIPIHISIDGSDLSILYRGKFDRIVTDRFDRLWVVECKTAKTFDTAKLENDPQVTSYLWAAKHIFPDRDVVGVVYDQFRKASPDYPNQLKAGGFSVDRKQSTSYGLYHTALMNTYGSIPSSYNEFLSYLASLETENGDNFIRRDIVLREEAWLTDEVWNIVYESLDMASAGSHVYPNPTRDCAWDCPFRSPCIFKSAGLDYGSLMSTMYRKRLETDYDFSSEVKQLLRNRWALPDGTTLADAKLRYEVAKEVRVSG